MLDHSGFVFDMRRWFRRWNPKVGLRAPQVRTANPGNCCFDLDHGARTRARKGYSPAPGFEFRAAGSRRILKPRGLPMLVRSVRQFEYPVVRLILVPAVGELASLSHIDFPNTAAVEAQPIQLEDGLVITSDGSHFYLGRS